MTNQPIFTTDKIIMMEDHDKAYYAWKEASVKDGILVHIDAHIDFGWLPDKDLSEISVTSEHELDSLLENQPLWNPFLKSRNKMIHIGNYIFPAMKQDIVKTFYWVVPDDSWKSRKGRKFIRRQLNQLTRVKKYAQKSIEVHKNYFHCRVFDKDIFVLSLDNLKTFDGPVLLDIDVDFLLTRHIWDDLRPKRTPWISAKQLVQRLSPKIKTIQILTIAYSVEGGFTPLEYKHLGDELRFFFDGSPSNSAAKDSFNLCRMHLDNSLPDYEKARNAYRLAIQLDNSYASAYNNYGILYLRENKIKLAEREFRKFLELDEGNLHVLSGLGYVALKENRLQEAISFFDRCILANKNLEGAILGKAVVYFKLGKLCEAKKLLLSLNENVINNAECCWYLGKICEKQRLSQEAIFYYKQAVLSGGEGPVAHFLLFRLYVKNGFYRRAFEELRSSLSMCKNIF